MQIETYGHFTPERTDDLEWQFINQQQRYTILVTTKFRLLLSIIHGLLRQHYYQEVELRETLDTDVYCHSVYSTANPSCSVSAFTFSETKFCINYHSSICTDITQFPELNVS